mmetsp:Transcript_19101/g.24403  ORF Transcript_19101/g.24403 Transcript_19101/m.24403 type:complete len:116 (+) Transcript_19101:2-349(+)
MQSPSRKNSTGLAVPTQPPPPAPPGPATPSLQYSPSRKNRSVHFGLHDESSQSQTTQTTGPLFPTLMDNRKNGDYSLSYSENSLQALDNNRNNHGSRVDEDKNLLSNRRLDFHSR